MKNPDEPPELPDDLDHTFLDNVEPLFKGEQRWREAEREFAEVGIHIGDYVEFKGSTVLDKEKKWGVELFMKGNINKYGPRGIVDKEIIYYAVAHAYHGRSVYLRRFLVREVKDGRVNKVPFLKNSSFKIQRKVRRLLGSIGLNRPS